MTMYGADYVDETSPCPPLPGTYYADASGGIAIRELEIPVGKTHSWANYLMAAGELLEVNDVITVTQGYVLIRSGALWAKINAVEITPATILTCDDVVRSGNRISGDVNADCRVDVADLMEMISQWVQCTDPNVPQCD